MKFILLLFISLLTCQGEQVVKRWDNIEHLEGMPTRPPPIPIQGLIEQSMEVSSPQQSSTTTTTTTMAEPLDVVRHSTVVSTTFLFISQCPSPNILQPTPTSQSEHVEVVTIPGQTIVISSLHKSTVYLPDVAETVTQTKTSTVSRNTVTVTATQSVFVTTVVSTVTATTTTTTVVEE